MDVLPARTGVARPPTPPRRAPDQVEHVLACLALFGEVVTTVAGSVADLDRWVQGAGDATGPRGTDAVQALVVPSAAWTRFVDTRSGGAPRLRGVVVCLDNRAGDGCGGGSSPRVSRPADPVVEVEVRTPGELLGAVAEALAGQAVSFVRVRATP